jgi:hypothetical protein
MSNGKPIGVWTLLAGGIFLAVNAKLHIAFDPKWILVAIFLVHLVWLIKVHDSEHFDKKLWDEYRRQALALLSHPSKEQEHNWPRLHKGWLKVKFWFSQIIWLSVEAGMTGVLCLVLWHLLS